MFSNVNNDDHFGAQLSSDSGIANDDSWVSEGVKIPPVERSYLGSFSPFGIRASRSFTAPSTPASTFSWRGGYYFIFLFLYLYFCHLFFLYFYFFSCILFYSTLKSAKKK